MLPKKDFPEGHPQTQDVLRFIKVHDMVFVRRQGGSPQGTCISSVAEEVRRRGGKALFGWMVETAEPLLISFNFHSVWERPDGSLLDITNPQERND